MNDRKHLAKKTLKEHHGLLRQIFKAALKKKLIEENPTANSDIKIPSDKANPRAALTPEQYFTLIKNIATLTNEEDRRMLALFLFTGIRRGEALGLRWQDIDITNRKIHIVQNVTHKGNQPVVGSPKTKNAIRSLPLNSKLLEILQPIHDIGYVIGGTKPISISAYALKKQH